MPTTLAFFTGAWGWPEMMVILVVALLVFGKRLPEVGRSLGKGLVEFKKGLKGVKDELDTVEQDVEEAANREDDEQPAQLDAPVQEQDKGPAVTERNVSEKTKAKEKAEA